MLDQQFAKMQRILAAPTGLFVVHGPTGTGKTTLMRDLATRAAGTERAIVDLSEVEIPYETTPAALLASIGTSDGKPTIVVFGTIRDESTAAQAVTLSEHHVVLADMHDDRAFRFVGRLVDLGIDPKRLESVVIGSCSLNYADPSNGEQDRHPYFRRSPGLSVDMLVHEAEELHGAWKADVLFWQQLAKGVAA
jgi:Tfp pilus assembly pilus retraction ATPase PilT